MILSHYHKLGKLFSINNTDVHESFMEDGYVV